MVESSEGAVMFGHDEDFPRSFGSYLLLARLAEGGMGEVFLAKSGAIAGIEKYCVVKTLRPQLTNDREYITRFVDEARIAVHLGHRNICQIYDVGRVKDRYYLAMELVAGSDLRTVAQRARQLGIPIPPELMLHIVGEVLEALDYAHRHADPVTGAPLHLVHRDVSPQNVMVNFEGEVKLIDFGLAKSNMKVETTQPHLVMGKMSYMAPEHARGDVVDGRADQFAAGVLLYELLAGERFYEGLSFEQMWGIAGRGGHRPRNWDSIEPSLRPVIARALHREPAERYPTCGDFRDAISRYLISRGEHASTRQMRQLMEQLFEKERAAHRDLLNRFSKVRLISRDGVDKESSKSFLISAANPVAPAASAGDFEEATLAESFLPKDDVASDAITAFEDTGVGIVAAELVPPEDLLGEAPPAPHDATDVTVAVHHRSNEDTVSQPENSGAELPLPHEVDEEEPTGPAHTAWDDAALLADVTATAEIPPYMLEATSAESFSESAPTVPDQGAVVRAPSRVWIGLGVGAVVLALALLAWRYLP